MEFHPYLPEGFAQCSNKCVCAYEAGTEPQQWKELTMLKTKKEKEKKENKRRCMLGCRGGGASVSGGGAWLLRLWAEAVQVEGGSVEAEPHSFSEVGAARLRQLHPVQHQTDPQRTHPGPRKPLPAAPAVEEVDEEEFLCGPELHPFSGSQHVQRRGGKLRPAEARRRPPRSGIHDRRRSWQLCVTLRSPCR